MDLITCKERILSNDYADIIMDFQIPELLQYRLKADACYHNVEGEFGILYAKRSEIPNINLSSLSYSFLPKCYGLMQLANGMAPSTEVEFDTTSLMEAGILQTQGQPLELTGRGVTIGFIDTGIQYENEVFRNEAGQSRITAIWDQTIQSGMPPEGFEYGTEYTREQINEALASENPRSIVPSTDENGHGTAIASVAAGSRLSGNRRFIGAAPDCNIVVVKLKEVKPYLRNYYLIPENVPCYQETDLIQAIQYLQKYVVSLQSPLVICLGIGTNQGDHSGVSALARYMDSISTRKSRALVISAGNEGNASHHYHGELTKEQPMQEVEIRVGGEMGGFVMDFWGGVPYIYTVSIRSPGGETIQWINPMIRKPQEFTFIFEKTRIIVEYLVVEQNSGSELIRFRMERPTPGIWTIGVRTEVDVVNGSFDIWLPITQFLEEETIFLKPTPYTTITDPGYVHRSVTTTAYNDANRSLYVNSGRGFARDGYVKPDVAAPGVAVSSVLGPKTGTGMAAAITAGGVAQIMQWAVIDENNILVDSFNVRNYLIRGAKREPTMSYPNREWGYGRLNIEGIFRFLAGT